MDDDQIIKIILNILDGLNSIHKNNQIFRNLKASNILFKNG